LSLDRERIWQHSLRQLIKEKPSLKIERGVILPKEPKESERAIYFLKIKEKKTLKNGSPSDGTHGTGEARRAGPRNPEMA
jgi:hypothetical protein